MNFTYFPEAKAPQQRQSVAPDEVFEFEEFANLKAIESAFGGVRLERFGNRVYLRGAFRVIDGGSWFFRIPKSCVPYPADIQLIQKERLLFAAGYHSGGAVLSSLRVTVRWSDRFCQVGQVGNLVNKGGLIAINTSYYMR
ncbi:hypothetical protein AB1K40_15705 [Vibrio cholerae]|uniref:hypothetical protein n=1 Tax=Vibrio cholerae TaxID=666 RepID=UPI00330D0FF0|nr:hypothetical protein [Vibrio cholerae]